MGATGRMGKELTALLAEPYKIGEVLFELTPSTQADIWIDFSHPDATVKLLSAIETPIVIGTTGFNEEQIKKIHDYAKKHPVLLAPNMSPGMAVIKKLLQHLSELKSMGFEAVLSEVHHKHKKDAPSGTAKSLNASLKDIGFNDVQLNVTRAGSEKGLHKITFYSDEEELSIEHRVSDRKVFSKGALLGAAFLIRKNVPGLYTYQEVVEAEPKGKGL
jgi:4-hydroxy-tetrahydrodipicolinate reductase